MTRSHSSRAPRSARAAQAHRRALTALMNGDISAALLDLDRALILAPRDATIHCNRAEALRRAGRHDDAVAAAHCALQLRPDYPQALTNLGAAQFAAGVYADAERSYTQRLALEPDDALALAARADCRREQGDWRGAQGDYESALRINPDLAHAHANLGPMLLQLGRSEDALPHCTRAVALAPQSGLARMNLGYCLFGLERYGEAMDAYAEAWSLTPDSALLACHIAAVFRYVGELDQATLWLDRAHALQPGRVGTRCAAAALKHELGDAEGALDDFRALVEVAPEVAEVHLGLAESLWDEGDADGAIASYRAASLARPQSAHIHAAVGDVLLSAGDIAAAESEFRAGLALNPQSVAALAGLGATLRGKLPDTDAAAIEHTLTRPWLSRGGSAALHSALAHHYDGVERYALAAQHAADTNRLQWEAMGDRGWRYDPTEHAAHITRLIATFTPAYFARTRDFGDNDARPVFVVGMPRSGTTLTEQILASHPQVLGIGERPYAQRILQQLPAMLDVDRDPLGAVEILDAPSACRSAERYVQRLDELVAGSGRDAAPARIVDKMPDNYQLLGWIHTLFPHARLIHVRRDPRDVALSCWLQRFAQIRWANHWDHIATRIAEYQRVMAHWRATLPAQLFEFDYEGLIDDQEGVSRQLIQFIGLDWDPACLTYYRSDRLVRTASVAQVRQPVYRQSLARWRRYGDALKPMLDALGQAGVNCGER